MFDKNTESLLNLLLEECGREEFRRLYKDICIAALIAKSRIGGRGVKLRPSLLRLENLSDVKTAANLLQRFKKTIGPVASGEALKTAAVDYIYKRLGGLL